MENIFKHILENNRHYKLRSYILQFLKTANTLEFTKQEPRICYRHTHADIQITMAGI